MAWPTRARRLHPVSGETYADLRVRARAMRADGCTMATIMAALDVSKPTAWKWVRDLPCHAEVAKANRKAVDQQHRIYPRGTAAYVAKLRHVGIAPEARLRLAQEAAR